MPPPPVPLLLPLEDELLELLDELLLLLDELLLDELLLEDELDELDDGSVTLNENGGDVYFPK